MTPKDSRERHPSKQSSESRQADRAARETEERYQALFSSLDCVYLHDSEGRFLDANPAALKPFGYEREEILSSVFPHCSTMTCQRL
jgi:PAS domain-containing protein